MEVFVEDDVYNDKFPKTSSSKHLYKETESGVNSMCEIMEKIAKEERMEGLKEGRNEGMLQTLGGLVKDGILTISEAAQRAGMTEKIFAESMEKFKA
jgi:hypothetical protein